MCDYDMTHMDWMKLKIKVFENEGTHIVLLFLTTSTSVAYTPEAPDLSSPGARFVFSNFSVHYVFALLHLELNVCLNLNI